MGLVLRHGVERTTADIEDLQIEEPHGALASLAAFAASWISWKKQLGYLDVPGRKLGSIWVIGSMG